MKGLSNENIRIRICIIWLVGLNIAIEIVSWFERRRISDP